MEKVKCADCDSLIAAGLNECPNCGGHTFKHLPLSEQVVSSPAETPEEKKPTNTIPPQVSKETPAKSKSIAPLIIGILIMIIGFITFSIGFTSAAHRAEWFLLTKVTFGGDFYTEIYNASYSMAKILNSIDEGLAAVSTSIYVAAGLVIESIGLAVVAMSLKK